MTLSEIVNFFHLIQTTKKMPDLDSCIPVPMDEKTLNEIVPKAKDWAIMHGAAMRSKANFSEDALQVHQK